MILLAASDVGVPASAAAVAATQDRGWKPPLKSTGWNVTVAMWSA